MKIQRRRYFIHPSSQLKYILMAVLPTLVMSVFCIFFLIKTGELMMRMKKDQLAMKFHPLHQAIINVNAEDYSEELTQSVEIVKNRALILENELRMGYFETLRKWLDTKRVMLDALVLFIILVGIMALFYSHRIAGPLVRLRRYVTMLAEGKDIPPVHIRHYDEFKELARAVDKLRKNMKAKGLLK